MSSPRPRDKASMSQSYSETVSATESAKYSASTSYQSASETESYDTSASSEAVSSYSGTISEPVSSNSGTVSKTESSYSDTAYETESSYSGSASETDSDMESGARSESNSDATDESGAVTVSSSDSGSEDELCIAFHTAAAEAHAMIARLADTIDTLIQPDKDVKKRVLAKKAFDAAEEAFKKEQYEDAIAEYTAAYDILLAIDREETGDYEQMEQCAFKKAHAYHFLNQLALEFNNLKQGYTILEHIAGKNRTRDNLYRLAKYDLLSARCCSVKSLDPAFFLDRAIRTLERIHSVHDVNTDEMVLWARCLMKKQKFPQAVEMLDDITDEELTDDILFLRAQCKIELANELFDTEDPDNLYDATELYLAAAMENLFLMDESERDREFWSLFNECNHCILAITGTLAEMISEAQNRMTFASSTHAFFGNPGRSRRILVIQGREDEASVLSSDSGSEDKEDRDDHDKSSSPSSFKKTA